MSTETAEYLVYSILAILIVSAGMCIVVTVFTFIYSMLQETARFKCRQDLFSLRDRLRYLIITCKEKEGVEEEDLLQMHSQINNAIRMIPHISWKINFLYAGNKEIDRLILERTAQRKRMLKKYKGTSIGGELTEINQELLSTLSYVFRWNSPVNTLWHRVIARFQSSRRNDSVRMNIFLEESVIRYILGADYQKKVIVSEV